MKRVIAAVLLPVICRWARRGEARILARGEPLTEQALDDARRIGVRHPERVRTLVVHSVPPRLPPLLRKIAERFRWGPAATAGMALGYGIFVRANQRHSRSLLLHELAHTAQYERLGFRPFLREYLRQCLTAGYPLGALEIEAQRIAHKLS